MVEVGRRGVERDTESAEEERDGRGRGRRKESGK